MAFVKNSSYTRKDANACVIWIRHFNGSRGISACKDFNNSLKSFIQCTQSLYLYHIFICIIITITTKSYL